MPTRADPRPAAVLGRLADGTAYYAPLGQLVRDGDDDTVQCHLCGRFLRHVLGYHLYRGHGWTRDAYITAFALPRSTSSLAEGLRAAQARRAAERLSTDPRVQAGLAQGMAAARSGDLHKHLRAATAERGVSPAQRAQARRNAAHAHAVRRAIVPGKVAAFCAREGIGDLPEWLRRRVLEQSATVAELADQVGVSIAVMQRLLDEHQLRLVRGRVRRSRSQLRLQRRLLELGFDGLLDYLTDRYRDRGWTVTRMRAELGCRDAVLTDGIRRHRLTRPTTPAEAERLRRWQGRSTQLARERGAARRQDLLAALGFPDLPSYLRDRYIDDRATVTAMARELHMSLHRLLEAMDAAGIARRPRHEAMHAHQRAQRAAQPPGVGDGG